MKLLKNFLTGILAGIFILSAGAVTVSAWEHPSGTPQDTLSAGEFKHTSRELRTSQIRFEARNTSVKQRVYFRSEYTPGNGKWYVDHEELVNPETSMWVKTSTKKDNYTTWHVVYDAYGIVTGATAYGWTWA